MNYDERIIKAKKLIAEADYVLIGVGAGLSTAAGFLYSGRNFTENFTDFIKKYGMQDMYSAGFYPFKTSEEEWAYWSRYAYINRYKGKANQTYVALLDLVKNKNYFVITTNVDHQFHLAGFDKQKMFYTQGDYGLFQCSVPCHQQTYDNQELIEQMVKQQKDCRIPTKLIPHCPKCGEEMEMNLRSDDRFVQDEGWYEHAKLYREFLKRAAGKKLVLLEIGVGFNTPAIIRYPFEQMTYDEPNTTLIRINKDYAICSPEIADKAIMFNEDTNQIIKQLH